MVCRALAPHAPASAWLGLGRNGMENPTPYMYRCLNSDCLDVLQGREALQPGDAELWFAGRALAPDAPLSARLGRNDKTRVVVRLQRRGLGAPAREPARPISPVPCTLLLPSAHPGPLVLLFPFLSVILKSAWLNAVWLHVEKRSVLVCRYDPKTYLAPGHQTGFSLRCSATKHKTQRESFALLYLRLNCKSTC